MAGRGVPSSLRCVSDAMAPFFAITLPREGAFNRAARGEDVLDKDEEERTLCLIVVFVLYPPLRLQVSVVSYFPTPTTRRRRRRGITMSCQLKMNGGMSFTAAVLPADPRQRGIKQVGEIFELKGSCCCTFMSLAWHIEKTRRAGGFFAKDGWMTVCVYVAALQLTYSHYEECDTKRSRNSLASVMKLFTST